jgi:hypothetical protein
MSAVILALDTSTKRTGYVLGPPGGPVRIGSFGVAEVNRGHLGRMLNDWAEQAWPLFEGVTHVYFEKPIHPAQTANLTTLRQLYALAAHVEFLAYHASADVCEVENRNHKQLIYGHGGSKPLNAVDYARAWGLNARNDDEADAAGVFLFALHTEFRPTFNRWLTIRRQAGVITRVEKPKKPRRNKTRRAKTAPTPSLFGS